MRIEVFGEKNTEDVLRLRLVQNGTRADLVIVDEKGNMVLDGRILYISQDGKIHRYTGVNSFAGLSLDLDNRVEVYTP